jgi:FkbM family methyltransferase
VSTVVRIMRRLNGTRFLGGDTRVHVGAKRLVWTLLYASRLRESLRFLARELRGETTEATYRLRRSGLRIHVRHGTGDLAIFRKIFVSGTYRPPSPAAALLQDVNRPLNVVDLGANIGLFGVFVLSEFADARIVAFEPDPSNLKALRQCVHANSSNGNWQVIEACASNGDGSLAFLGGRQNLSRKAHGTDEAGAIIVPVRDAFPFLERADLIKIDIEGSEWDLLLDPRFGSLPAKAIVMEYHRACCPEDDFRTAAISRLTEAGYTVEPVSHDEANGIVWAWRASARWVERPAEKPARTSSAG